MPSVPSWVGGVWRSASIFWTMFRREGASKEGGEEKVEAASMIAAACV
jgi:hypothetical protein